ILVAMMPLAEGNPLRDPATGNLSLRWAIVIFGGVVVFYTMFGGLWAVLMTDVLQFIILNLAVLFVVPLALGRAGGIEGFISGAPEGFFEVVKDQQYTVFFLAGWVAIHFFMIGAEWAFVQRFLCVPSKRDARRGTYLFGILYLCSPLLWLLPPMIHRVTDPGADAEQAYILSCQAVLPIGMVGLMVAAMFSATASMVSSQLNVFSGVLTKDLYQPLAKKQDARSLLRAGRFFTILLGAVLVLIALEIEKFGQVKDLIISITELMVVPLLAPSLWGLFSRRIGGRAVLVTGIAGFLLGCLVRFGFGVDAWFSEVVSLQGLNVWVAENASGLKTFVGVIFPLSLLLGFELAAKGEHPGWQRLRQLKGEESGEEVALPPNPIAAKVVAWALVVCALVIFSLLAVNESHHGLLALFGGVLVAIALVIFKLGAGNGQEVTDRKG
ncbi:MAG: sodium:solute symporter family transporter, partial [Verrucomicrobiales bacterium]